ncbi:INO80 complex, subunit Ies4 [Phyllosticta citricarpa]|uniref:INO80 complex, subunit Ies4 n=2 Tax=Phyllosticta TaxID=121621 RepID=A0ABR1L7G7_9PEZI
MTARSPKSLLITLRLAPLDLAKFPTDQAPQTDARSKSLSSATPTSTPAEQTTDPSVSQNALDAQPAPTTNGTTPMAIDANNAQPTPPQNGGRRKGIPGPKPGSKRGAALTADGMPKPRGKPGPKKKPRLGDPNSDANGIKGPFAGVMPITQKLGPKANQGAINAGLRALDRSGKPCRRWEKKGFQLKSFTGVSWEIPTWRAPSKKNTGVDEHGDVKSDTTSNSETAKVNESSAMASEKSSSGGNMDTPNKPLPNLASSPIPEMTPL